MSVSCASSPSPSLDPVSSPVPSVPSAPDTPDEVTVALNGSGEVFLLVASLFESVKGSVWRLMLTDRAMLKLDANGQVRTRREILDVHSVEQDQPLMPKQRKTKYGQSYEAFDPKCFSVYSYKNAFDLRADKMKGAFGLGMNFDSFLQLRRFCCETESECLRWVAVLNRLVITQWQQMLERYIIPEPEVYQHHCCVIKVNRKVSWKTNPMDCRSER